MGHKDFGKSETNNTNINNTDINNIYNQSINHNNIISEDEYFISDNDDKIDMIDYDTQIKNNINLDLYLEDHKYNEIYPIYKLMCDIMRLNPKGTTTVNGEKISISLIQKRFLKDINQNHIEYVLESIKEIPDKINNIRGYLITALYNAVGTIDAYFTNKVYSDLYNSATYKYKPQLYDLLEKEG